jgi:hypothetical protein
MPAVSAWGDLGLISWQWMTKVIEGPEKLSWNSITLHFLYRARDTLSMVIAGPRDDGWG